MNLVGLSDLHVALALRTIHKGHRRRPYSKIIQYYSRHTKQSLMLGEVAIAESVRGQLRGVQRALAAHEARPRVAGKASP